MQTVELSSWLSHQKFGDEVSWQDDSFVVPILPLVPLSPLVCSILSSTAVKESYQVPPATWWRGEFAESVCGCSDPAPPSSGVPWVHRLLTFCFCRGLVQEKKNFPRESWVVWESWANSGTHPCPSWEFWLVTFLCFCSQRSQDTGCQCKCQLGRKLGLY